MIYPPVYRRVLWGGVEVTVYGACRDWNFSGVNHGDMESRNPWITSAIAQVISAHDIKRALAPKPESGTRIVTAGDTKTPILGIPVLAGFFRGAEADGILIERPGDAYFLASADIPVVVIYDGKNHRVFCLHCGLDSLVDRNKLQGRGAREFESVIDSAISRIGINEDPHDLRAFIAASIGPDSFKHPITAFVNGVDGQSVINPDSERNRLLVEHLSDTCDYYSEHEARGSVVTCITAGDINLTELIRFRLLRAGVQLKNVQSDGHDTAADKYRSGEYVFHSHRRDGGTKRNLVVVKLL